MNEYKQSEEKKAEIKKRKLERMKAKSQAENAASRKLHRKKQNAINLARIKAEEARQNPDMPIAVQQQLALARTVTQVVQHRQRVKMMKKATAPTDDALMNIASESILKKASDEGVDLNNLEPSNQLEE